MPSYRGHFLGSLCAYFVTALFLYKASLVTHIEWLFCAILGGLFPDIDTTSKGRKIWFRIFVLITVLIVLQQKFYLIPILLFISTIPLVVRHRGILHNIWFISCLLLITLVCVYWYKQRYFFPVFYDAVFFFAGVIAHLWLDMGFRRTLRW